MTAHRSLTFDEALEVLQNWTGKHVELQIRFRDHSASIGWMAATQGTLTSVSKALPQAERWTGHLDETPEDTARSTFNVVRNMFDGARLTQNPPADDTPEGGYSPEFIVVHRGIETVVTAYI